MTDEEAFNSLQLANIEIERLRAALQGISGALSRR